MDNNIKADNRVISNNKEIDRRIRINDIENKIDTEKDNQNLLFKQRENAYQVSKSINRCIEILSRSISGGGIESELSDMSDENRRWVRSINDSIDEKLKNSNDNLKNLYDERENIIEEYRNEYNYQGHKEENEDEEKTDKLI